MCDVPVRTGCLDSLCALDYPRDRLDVVIIEGTSSCS
jgi:hypothetical protein